MSVMVVVLLTLLFPVASSNVATHPYFVPLPSLGLQVCYSWWDVSVLSMLGRLHWINVDALRDYILRCQDLDGGGIADFPGDMPDVFHTFFGLSFTSFLPFTRIPCPVVLDTHWDPPPSLFTKCFALSYACLFLGFFYLVVFFSSC